MTLLLTFIFVFILSWLGVGLFRKWSEGRSILDVPNERSSHQRPTPVGGGLVIVLFTIFSMLLYELSIGAGVRYWGFYVGGLAIAMVSWIDDIKPLPMVLRLAVHIFGALVAVLQIGSFTEIDILPGLTLSLGFLGPVISFFWIVGLTNAFNFMDGIDGLAGTQAVVASGGWALLAVFLGIDTLLFAAIVVMASSLGFLMHNWPPAKVFMGDVGSNFLGYSFAVFPLIALSVGNPGLRAGKVPVVAVGFVWLFLADSLVTRFRRAISGETFWDANRKHMYQILIKAGLSHLRVTLVYGAMMIIVTVSVLTELYAGIFGLSMVASVLALIFIAVLVMKFKGTDRGLVENNDSAYADKR